jgi:hypothetical protein
LIYGNFTQALILGVIGLGILFFPKKQEVNQDAKQD